MALVAGLGRVARRRVRRRSRNGTEERPLIRLDLLAAHPAGKHPAVAALTAQLPVASQRQMGALVTGKKLTTGDHTHPTPPPW